MIALLCHGHRNQEIADRLFINEKTVRNCLTRIYSKVEVANRLELVFYGLRHGLSRVPE
jgi:DNA-binding NarL/FixJ family response regulator